MCEALFASDVQPSQRAQPREVRAAVRRTIRVIGVSACAARVAQEFGDHPDTAVTRMRWARDAVSVAYRANGRSRAPAPLRPPSARTPVVSAPLVSAPMVSAPLASAPMVSSAGPRRRRAG
jgi:hypothetical protein